MTNEFSVDTTSVGDSLDDKVCMNGVATISRAS